MRGISIEGFHWLLGVYKTKRPAPKHDKLGLPRLPVPIAFHDHLDIFDECHSATYTLLSHYDLRQHEFDALVSFACEFGTCGLASSRLLWIMRHRTESRRWRRLLSRVWEGYVYNDRGEAIEVASLGRRRAECMLFLTGKY